MNPLMIGHEVPLIDNKPILTLDFVDFGFLNKSHNFFTRMLSYHYTVIIHDKPQVLIYSNQGSSHLHRLYPCKRIFWTGESTQPDYKVCDFSMSPLLVKNERHCRLPYYVLGCEASASDLIKKPNEVHDIMAESRKGCAVVISNSGKKAQYRNIFFRSLQKHIHVASGGRSFNNIGGILLPGGPAKQSFIKKYKFNMCFENKSLPGYVTEKITEAMMARCIPIYWGDPDIVKEFNPKSFINVHEFSSEEKCFKRILEIENDNEAYKEMLSEPYFFNNQPNEWYQEKKYADFLKYCIESSVPNVGSRQRWYQLGRWKLAKRMHL